MKTFILDDEEFAVLVMRQRDGRELSVTVNNWQEIKDAIELSIYQDALHNMSLRPTEEEGA